MEELDINDPNRVAAENADIAKIVAEKKAAKQEIGGATPLPAIPQPQMPTTQLRNGVREEIGAPNGDATAQQPSGVDIPNERGGGRFSAYGDKIAKYGADGNISEWVDRSGNRVDAPKSMQMISGLGYADNNTTTDGAIRAAQDFARKSDEERLRQKAAYNREVGIAMSAALQRAFSEGNQPMQYKDGNSYLTGYLGTAEISMLNEKLRNMGRHTIEKAGVFQNVDATGRAVGDPRFLIRFKQDGARGTAGKSTIRSLSKAEFMDTMRGAFDALGQSGEAENFEKTMFRDYQAENMKRKQDEENRVLQTRLTEAKIGDVAAKVSGVSAAHGSNGRAAIAAAIKANPTAFAQALLTNQAFLDFASRGKPMTEEGKDGKYIPMIDPKTGEQMYERKSPDETMEFVASILNGFDGGKFVTDRMQKLNMLNAMAEAEKNALNAQTAQPQTQTQPAQTAHPQSTATAQPAPTAQPASPNLTDLSAPTQGGANPTNIVENLAQQTFGDPSAPAPTVRTPAPTAKNNSLTDEQIDNLERKPNETDEDYAERKADIRAGLRKKDFVKAGGVYETNEDGTEKFRLKDWEFLDENEGRNTIRESDEFTDEMMNAQKLIHEKKAAYESILNAKRKEIRAEALKRHPTSKAKRDKYISERMSEWEEENDPRLSKKRDSIMTSGLMLQ